MTQPAADSLATRVLLLAPTAKDAEVTASLLTRAGVAVTACDTTRCLIDEMNVGAGAILMTEEALGAKGAPELVGVLKQQSPWYKIPLVILMHEGSARASLVRSLENVTLLERPAAMRTVISAIAPIYSRWKRATQDALAALSPEERGTIAKLARDVLTMVEDADRASSTAKSA